MRHGSRVGDRPSTISVQVAGVCAIAATAWLASHVANRGGLRRERWAAFDKRSLPPAIATLEEGISLFAYPAVGFPLAFLIADRFRRGGVRGTSVVPLAAALGWMGHRGLKVFLRRSRPPSQRGRSNYRSAFPSGHATAATAIATATAYLLWRGRHPMRRVVIVAVVPPALIGASRVVLGRHWPTDVVGGWATGIAATALAVTIEARERTAPR